MKIQNIFFIIILLLSVFVHQGCENTITSGKDVIFPDSLVSYSQHVQPFIAVTCAYQGCHSAETAAAGIVMSDYSNLRQTYSWSMVIAGNPDASLLVQYLEYKQVHKSTIYFIATDNQKNGIRKWIKEGAKNN